MSRPRNKSIEDWLHKQGIDRYDGGLTSKLWEKGFIWTAVANKILSPLGLNLVFNPKAYDVSQGQDFKYDLRVKFLTWFDDFLGDLPNGSIITEGGCGTLLDSSYLAEQHKNHRFRIYDMSGQMIRYSRKRSQDNLELNVEYHQRPREEEVFASDVVFERASLNSKACPYAFQSDVIGLRRRVKAGGYLIFGSSYHYELDKLNEILEGQKIKFLDKHFLAKSRKGDVYTFVYQAE
jgi:hypothetical protein